MTARILLFEFPVVPTRPCRTEEPRCATCGARGEAEDMLRDRYSDQYHCMKCVTEAQLAAGTLNVERRIHEMEKQIEMYQQVLLWIRNNDNCPPDICGKAITALAGMMPMGV